MKLLDLLNKDTIIPDLKSVTKTDVIKELIEKLLEIGKVTDKDAVVNAVLEREKIMSTGIGNGIAIPHGKTDAVDDMVAIYGRSVEGIEYDSLDDEKSHIFFLLVTPKDMSGPHVKILARISRLLRHDYFREALLKADTSEKIIEIIEDEERKF